MLNERFKKTFNHINPDDNRKKETLESILIRSNFKIYSLKMGLASLTIILFFVAFGVMAAEKENFFRTLHVKYEKNEEKENVDTYVSSVGIVELNYQADIPNVDFALNSKYEYDFIDLENRLGIKMLKSGLFDNKRLKQSITEKVDGNISYAQFLIEEIELEKYMIARYSITMKTKYYKNDKNIENLPYSHNSKEYYIKDLETNAIISYDSSNAYRITFDYDNISYGFLIMFKNNIEGERDLYSEFDSLLNSLKY